MTIAAEGGEHHFPRGLRDRRSAALLPGRAGVPLVSERHWTTGEYGHWLADELACALLAAPHSAVAGLSRKVMCPHPR
jgi:hypothetical protein